MSDLSEQIDKVLERLMQSETGDEEVNESKFVNVAAPEYTKSVPGLQGAVEHNQVHCLRAVQKAFRKFAGSAPFESPVNALERTKERMTEILLPTLMSAFADGVQMGQGQSFCFKKYNMFKKLDEVFNSKAWRSESDLIMMPFQTDFDSVLVFSRLIEWTVLHMGSGSGYHNFKGDRVNKIWDLWLLTAHSTCIHCYQAGVELGKQWREANTLEGIMAATEQEQG